MINHYRQSVSIYIWLDPACYSTTLTRAAGPDTHPERIPFKMYNLLGTQAMVDPHPAGGKLSTSILSWECKTKYEIAYGRHQMLLLMKFDTHLGGSETWGPPNPPIWTSIATWWFARQRNGNIWRTHLIKVAHLHVSPYSKVAKVWWLGTVQSWDYCASMGGVQATCVSNATKMRCASWHVKL